MLVIARLFAAVVLLWTVPAAQAQNKLPTERGLEALVKSSLLSFNDANVTGNYTVFHAKLSKPFRQQFSPEKLKATFKEFADKNIDIDLIAALKPTYDPVPVIDDNGRLIVKGFFPTEPARVVFELDFIPSDGEWKLVRINVKTTRALE
ncbi:MAG: hypothetical protein Q8K93_22520 [Reyranella sp.]|uniref:hypothetical protein n=1 Tax=Reyranella sp. TaxID=1929291 RepID=UPI0027320999|nr:hypothetical protein [Reyranella sp.]MDP1964968.1 hypothetical protein [Reyranella sp.]MDP2378495.1 hypothetical protein [Reyranella sp.]